MNERPTLSRSERLRRQLHTVIFEADTPAGRAFDVALMIAIVISLLVVILESVRSLGERYADWFHGIEWALTILFTIEYLLRLY